MSHISESKRIILSVSHNQDNWYIEYLLDFYDSDELAVPEFSYSCLSDDEFPEYSDTDFLADEVDNFLTGKFARGLGNISDGEIIELVI